MNHSEKWAANGVNLQRTLFAARNSAQLHAAGLVTFDRGSFTFKGTRSFNGLVVPAVGTGTYTVNDDCTGSAVDNLGTPYDFVIADGGAEISIIFAVPGTAITGVAKRL